MVASTPNSSATVTVEGMGRPARLAQSLILPCMAHRPDPLSREGLTRADEGESVKAPGDAALVGQAIPIAAGWRDGGGGERVHNATGDSERVGRAWEGPEKRALQKWR